MGETKTLLIKIFRTFFFLIKGLEIEASKPFQDSISHANRLDKIRQVNSIH